MASSVWSGFISLGLMNIPVKLYKASDDPTRIKFNQINSKTGNRVRRKSVDEVTGDEVEHSDIVKGYEVDKDQYITFTPEEINSLTPERSTSVQIEGFVDANEVPVLRYDEPYFMGSDEVGARPHRILSEAMSKTGKIAIGKIVMRSQERLCAIVPDGDGGLLLSTVRWKEQVRDSNVTPEVEVQDEEVEMGVELIERMTNKVDIDEYSSDFNEQVEGLIRARAEDPDYEPVKVTRLEPDNPEDLMDTLRMMLEQERAAEQQA